jgi:hypothetical protein
MADISEHSQVDVSPVISRLLKRFAELLVEVILVLLGGLNGTELSVQLYVVPRLLGTSVDASLVQKCGESKESGGFGLPILLDG